MTAKDENDLSPVNCVYGKIVFTPTKYPNVTRDNTSEIPNQYL